MEREGGKKRGRKRKGERAREREREREGEREGESNALRCLGAASTCNMFSINPFIFGRSLSVTSRNHRQTDLICVGAV